MLKNALLICIIMIVQTCHCPYANMVVLGYTNAITIRSLKTRTSGVSSTIYTKNTLVINTDGDTYTKLTIPFQVLGYPNKQYSTSYNGYTRINTFTSSGTPKYSIFIYWQHPTNDVWKAALQVYEYDTTTWHTATSFISIQYGELYYWVIHITANNTSGLVDIVHRVYDSGLNLVSGLDNTVYSMSGASGEIYEFNMYHVDSYPGFNQYDVNVIRFYRINYLMVSASSPTTIDYIPVLDDGPVHPGTRSYGNYHINYDAGNGSGSSGDFDYTIENEATQSLTLGGITGHSKTVAVVNNNSYVDNNDGDDTAANNITTPIDISSVLTALSTSNFNTKSIDITKAADPTNLTMTLPTLSLLTLDFELKKFKKPGSGQIDRIIGGINKLLKTVPEKLSEQVRDYSNEHINFSKSGFETVGDMLGKGFINIRDNMFDTFTGLYSKIDDLEDHLKSFIKDQIATQLKAVIYTMLSDDFMKKGIELVGELVITKMATDGTQLKLLQLFETLFGNITVELYS